MASEQLFRLYSVKMLNCGLISLFLSALCLMEASSRHTTFTDFYLESAKIVNATANLPFHGNITLKRSGHNHPKVFFEFETVDLRNYHTEAKVYYSPLGNRRFMLLPYKFPRQPICTVLNSEIAHKMIQSLQNFSNLPDYDEKVELCDLMSLGHFFVHDYELVRSVLPKFTPTGRYRLLALFYENEKNILLTTVEFEATFL